MLRAYFEKRLSLAEGDLMTISYYSQMATPGGHDGDQCPPRSDDRFGPRVDTACRAFDFTLLFEDAFLVALPAALMILLLPMRLRRLWRMSPMMRGHLLAGYKTAAMVSLIVFRMYAFALRIQSHRLYTRIAIPAEVLAAAANFGALVLSFLEDQRSAKPSDLLVLYYSALTILGIPRVRTLWLYPTSDLVIQRAIGTLLPILTVAVVITESLGKTKHLRPAYKVGLSDEQTTNFWSRSFFVWLLPLFQRGYSTVFHLQDLPDVDGDLKGSVTRTDLEAAWRARQGRYRLVRATLRANSWPLLSAVVPRLCLSVFTFCQPFLIQAAVSQLSRDSDKRDHERFGQALIGAFVLVNMGVAVSRAVYWRQTYRMLAKVRAGLTIKIYHQTLSLESHRIQDSAALTLMGTDVERIAESCRFLHEAWAAIPEIVVGVWLLARQVSYASVAPLVVCVTSLVGSSLVAKHFGPAQKSWVACVEKRVGATASILSNIKSIKMLHLMDHAGETIEKLRATEIAVSAKFRALRVWAIMIGNAPGLLAPFVTLAVYALTALAAGNESLPVEKAFTSLALVALVTEPLLMLCQALLSLTQALACFSRIDEFLRAEPASRDFGSVELLPSDYRQGIPFASLPGPAADRVDSLVTFQDAHISWGPKRRVVLHDLDLTIRGGLTAIVGSVGSGKSSLLASIIGETTVVSGSILRTDMMSRVAFCSQTPWLVNDTIKRNIIGDSEFDPTWFDFAISCCALQKDLDTLPAGYLTVVGTNGSSLSGGQRQRVALARVVYSKLPVVVLDDSTSGLDPTAARTITAKLFGNDGHFRKAGISVVLATHSPSILPYMDTIIVLGDGQLVASGTYEEISQQRPGVLSTEAQHHLYASRSRDGDVGGEEQSPPVVVAIQPAAPVGSSGKGSPLHRDGNWHVYLYYAEKAGKLSMFLWAFSTFAGAVSNAYSTLWVDRWTSANAQADGHGQLGLYLGIYFLLAALATISPFIECWVFFLHIVKDTAIKLHSDLLRAVLGAPFYFFLESDLGSMTNRFSQDMNLIDMTLPSQAIQFTTGFASCLVQLLVLCVLGKYLAAVVPVLAAVLFAIQRYYLRTSRQLRILDIEAKAPLYAHFIDTIGGISTIRAFGWDVSFSGRLAEILDLSQRPFYMLLCVQQWLTLVLDLVAGALAITLVALALSVSVSGDGSGSLRPGALGVALVLTLQFNGLLTQTIQSWTKLETSIGAVARVQQFVTSAPVEPGGAQVPSHSWPDSGSVQICHLTAAYRPGAAAVLTDVSLTIAAGEKLAVCGPSGSGKTSLIMAILQLMDLRSGQILIDGIDTALLDGRDIRKQLNVIPQEPFFLSGNSLRFNLDPSGRASDTSIETAIRRVSPGLWERLCANLGSSSTGHLDAMFVAAEWSHGERQLLCLVRALLVPSKVVILDEAMSSVDDKTEALMQQIVETEFRDRTVISVVHRYSHIAWSDRVVVMQGGRIVECDSPHTLLQKDGSVFRKLYSTGV